LNYRIKQDTL